MSTASGTGGVAVAGMPRPRRSVRRRLLDLLALLVVGAVFGLVLPRLASYDEIGRVLAGLSGPVLVGLAALALWNLVTYWLVLVAVLPALRLREAAVATLGSTAVANTLPAGAALGMGTTWRMFADWGVSSSDFALYTLVSGVWNQFVKLGMPLVALALLVAAGNTDPALVTAAVVGLVVLAVAVLALVLVLRGEHLAARVGEVLQRVVGALFGLVRRPAPTGVAAAVTGFRVRAARLLAARGWWITLATLVSHLTLWLVLLACLRACGVGGDEVPWQESLAAFAFVRLLTALPVTPGGLGVVELGLTGPLAAGLPGDAAAKVVAGVLLYRALTYVLPIPLGGLALLWWRLNRSWRMTPAERAVRSEAAGVRV
jgi:putative heme transporter